MTINEAYEQTVPGQRIKHTERQLVLVRQNSFIHTISGLGPAWAEVLSADCWVILPKKAA
jgi:hypothetical protein